jgi:hypothetical protein
MAPAVAIEALLTLLQDGLVTADELETFRQNLLKGDPALSIQAIREFLAKGRDAPTGEEFVVGKGGVLGGAPTLRVLLLDLLGRIARTSGSDAGVQVGRTILEQKTSADEWAMALRNVGWQDPNARAFLAAKGRELLLHEAWRSKPSAGYLESFDTAVFTADPAFVPLLTELSKTADLAQASPDAPEEEVMGDVQRAATVALDRLSETAPLAVMKYFNEHPEAFADRPFLRADYFAKVDLRDAEQRTAIEKYLSRDDVELDEKLKVVDGLASPASIITDALLTAPALREDSPGQQQAVRTTYTAWLAANRFPTLQPQIREVLQALGR